MNHECQTMTRNDCLRVLNGREQGLVQLRRSNLVVIGGTGFIGSWIAETVAVLNDEYKFDITLTLISRSTEQFVSRLPHLANRPDVKLIKSDVRQLGQFPMDADWVIHAAANPDVRTHASNPLDTASVIVDGTMSVMRTAERLGSLKRLLYMSSGLVNVTQTVSSDALSEVALGAPTPDASFMYPNAKRFAETICSAARVQSRVPVLIARPFSFIGPYQSLETPWAQTTFLSDALRNRPIRVLGDGQVVRSYLYGSDAAYWLLKILTTGQNGDVVNVGSSEGVSLQSLAKIVADSFKIKPDILLNTSPRNAGRSGHLLPDTTHALNQYGLSVITPLQEAVKLTAKWHVLQNS